MTTYFYRYRKSSYLLGQYKELENQEIYFASQSELNDPVDGYKNISWAGDMILWTNLLKHYVLCTMHAIYMAVVEMAKPDSDLFANLVFQVPDDLPDTPIRDIYAAVWKKISQNEAVQCLLSTLSSSSTAVLRYELTSYLRIIHLFAIDHIINDLRERGFPLADQYHPPGYLLEDISNNLKKSLKYRSDDPVKRAQLFRLSEHSFSSVSMMNGLQAAIPEERRAWAYATRDFPRLYVTALSRLLYQDWYTACFVTDPTDSAMWGTYGDSHRGFCLKFRATPNTEGQEALDIRHIVAISGGADEDILHYDYRAHPFEKVQYDGGFPEINFFTSLGNLSRQTLRRFWYSSESGALCSVGERVLAEDKEWRQEYWDVFHASSKKKTPEWAHECEHRIILSSIHFDRNSKESRKLKYRFSDLSGIIFGINAGNDDKLSAIKIIKEKCAKENRTIFEFWQAYFSEESNKIELLPIIVPTEP